MVLYWAIGWSDLLLQRILKMDILLPIRYIFMSSIPKYWQVFIFLRMGIGATSDYCLSVQFFHKSPNFLKLKFIHQITSTFLCIVTDLTYSLCTRVYESISFSVLFSLLFLFNGFPSTGSDAKKQLKREMKREGYLKR